MERRDSPCWERDGEEKMAGDAKRDGSILRCHISRRFP